MKCGGGEGRLSLAPRQPRSCGYRVSPTAVEARPLHQLSKPAVTHLEREQLLYPELPTESRSHRSSTTRGPGGGPMSESGWRQERRRLTSNPRKTRHVARILRMADVGLGA